MIRVERVLGQLRYSLDTEKKQTSERLAKTPKLVRDWAKHEITGRLAVSNSFFFCSTRLPVCLKNKKATVNEGVEVDLSQEQLKMITKEGKG